MSEYSKRVLAFSAVAIILGVSLSLGIAYLPSITRSLGSPTGQISTSTTGATVDSSTVSTGTMNVPSTTESTSSGAMSSTITGTTVQSTIQTSTVATLTTTNVNQTAVSSSTTGSCGSPGVYCGNASITSLSLKVGSNSSTLQFTLAEIGNEYIGSATVYVNGTVIGTPPTSEYAPPGNIMLNVTANQSTVLVLVIPASTISIQAGLSYSVMAYIWLGVPGQPADSGLATTSSVTAS